jgi:hypothetical protein
MADGWEAQIRPRSGLAAKKGITVLNTPGTIDAAYTGEIMVIVQNNGTEIFEINAGDRIAQMVFKRVPMVQLKPLREKPSNESRGENGFGSSGVSSAPKASPNDDISEQDMEMLLEMKEISEKTGLVLPPDIQEDLKKLKDISPETP